MASSLGRPSPPYYVAIVVLVASLAIGSALVIMLVSRPAAETIRFAVAEPIPEDCPAGEGAPVCYSFDVTNGGEARATALCSTAAPSGSEAQFLNEESTITVPLEAGETRGVLVKVLPAGTATVAEPTLDCAAA